MNKDTVQYLYDVHHVRYRLLATTPGQTLYNWLFFPGGPGIDSAYFVDLIQGMALPGNCWLVDLPGNGSNQLNNQADNEVDFDGWEQAFLEATQRSDNVILVGHSFGGMYPLLFPQLENILKGFVILNSAPTLWLEAAAQCAKAHNIPPLTEPIAEFEANPNQDTFNTMLLACAPYYFPPSSMEQGRALLKSLVVNYHAAVWWLKKAHDTDFNAQWIPQAVETLIIGATHDCITPISVFQNDERFKRPNITQVVIEEAGHLPWLEQMPMVKAAFEQFVKKVSLA